MSGSATSVLVVPEAACLDLYKSLQDRHDSVHVITDMTLTSGKKM
jgi:hypothetical protein